MYVNILTNLACYLMYFTGYNRTLHRNVRHDGGKNVHLLEITLLIGALERVYIIINKFVTETSAKKH